MRHDQTIKVILPAGDIPDGSTVTKVSGSQEFILRHTLKIFGEHGVEINNKSDAVLFMISINGVINTIEKNKELCWLTTPSYLQEWADEYEPEDK